MLRLSSRVRPRRAVRQSRFLRATVAYIIRVASMPLRCTRQRGHGRPERLNLFLKSGNLQLLLASQLCQGLFAVLLPRLAVGRRQRPKVWRQCPWLLRRRRRRGRRRRGSRIRGRRGRERFCTSAISSRAAHRAAHHVTPVPFRRSRASELRKARLAAGTSRGPGFHLVTVLLSVRVRKYGQCACWEVDLEARCWPRSGLVPAECAQQVGNGSASHRSRARGLLERRHEGLSARNILNEAEVQCVCLGIGLARFMQPLQGQLGSLEQHVPARLH